MSSPSDIFYSRLIIIAIRVVKSSWLPVKIAAYFVIISQLLCLAFLYGWCFLNKISLDWLLTLTTQPSASKLSDNPVTKRQEEPTILISRLLLCMQDTMFYVASFVWISTRNEWNAQYVIWSHMFWPSITWNVPKAQYQSKSILTSFRASHPHSVTTTFGYY